MVGNLVSKQQQRLSYLPRIFQYNSCGKLPLQVNLYQVQGSNRGPKSTEKCKKYHFWVVLVNKAQNKDMDFFFQLSNLSQLVFVLENPTHWGLETAVYPIFVKPVLDIFAVCSLVPRVNVSNMQQNYLCPKSQNYLPGMGDLRFFLSYGLRATIKITICSTFYVLDNLSSSYN